jgi:hypothetical protein
MLNDSIGNKKIIIHKARYQINKEEQSIQSEIN